MGFVNEQGNGIRRTIDYERNAIMSSTGGSFVGIVYFQIIWNDAQIEFSALESISSEGKTPTAVSWKVHSFKIPEFLNNRRLEIINLIEESLQTYGLYGMPDWNGSVEVSFDPRLQK